jgi:hypothetical protein
MCVCKLYRWMNFVAGLLCPYKHCHTQCSTMGFQTASASCPLWGNCCVDCWHLSVILWSQFALLWLSLLNPCSCISQSVMFVYLFLISVLLYHSLTVRLLLSHLDCMHLVIMNKTAVDILISLSVFISFIGHGNYRWKDSYLCNFVRTCKLFSVVEPFFKNVH